MFYCGFMYWSNISFISYCLYESEPCLRRWQLQRCKVSLEYILLILAVFQGFICHFLYTTHSFNSIMNILLILIKTLCNKYYYYWHYTSWDDWDRLITLLTLLVNSKNKKKWTKGNYLLYSCTLTHCAFCYLQDFSLQGIPIHFMSPTSNSSTQTLTPLLAGLLRL